MADLSPLRERRWAPPVNMGPPPRGKARAHSRVVRVLRWLLPMIMAAMVATLLGLIISHALRRRDAASRDAATPIELVNPHFFGRDGQGRPYTLGAKQAARDVRSFQTVLLSYPTVILHASDADKARTSTITADSGVYHEDSRLLYLKGHVRADNAADSRFASDQAVVDTRTGRVSSPSALSSHTPLGNLQSTGFDVFDKGDRVVFTGGVHARLNSH
jgi:lipopolysaccharide export system protein LptC